MLRIALVTPMLPVPHDTTRGRYIHETAASLARLATLRVFFQQARYPSLPGLTPRSFIEGRVGADYRLGELDVQAFDYPSFPVVSRALNGWSAARVLLPRVRAFKPDLLLAYWIYPDGHAAVQVARRLGVPCVVGALGSDIHVRSGLSQRLTRRTIAAADALLTVSEAMRQAAIRDYAAAPAKVHTIVNGFNTGVFGVQPQAQARAALAVPADAQLVVYVGRFVEAKGMRELVASLQVLAPSHPRLRLALIGDGVMRDELRALISRSGLDDRVLQPGGLEPAGVAQWIAASDLLTLPSWSEGYPNVVVEALACGRPVVATDVGGTREIVRADNGILIAPRDVGSLTQGLQEALQRHWDHAAIAASMRRSWDDVAAETLEVCRHVLKPRA